MTRKSLIPALDAMVIAIIAIVIAAVVGWGMNVYTLMTVSMESGQTVLRLIGVFVMPLGAVLGYFPA